MDTDAAAILGHLANAGRRRVIAAIVLGASTVEEIKSATGLGTRSVVTSLGRLRGAGLVVDDEGDHFWLVEEVFRQAAIGARNHPPDEHADAPAATARVLRSFVRDGRLLSIPMQRAKRLIVLDLVAQDFEPGRRYKERTVNAVLRRWHDDTAALRRYLVDEGFFERDAGEYWRGGGTVDV